MPGIMDPEYQRRAERVRAAVTGTGNFGIQDLPNANRNLVGEGITKGLETVLGMPEEKVAPPLVPRRAAGLTPPAAAEAATPAPPAAASRHPAEGYADPYAFAEAMVANPKNLPKFKAWVDKNDIPGLGYVENAETGEITPTISRPEPRGGMGLGRDLTIGELEALGPYVNAREAAAARREGLGIERQKLAFEIDKFARTNDMKDPQNFMKLVISVAPKTKVTTYDSDGNATVEERPNLAAGAKFVQDMGYAVPKGFKIPAAAERKVMTEQEARSALTSKNITGKDADRYINEYKKRGVVQ